MSAITDGWEDDERAELPSGPRFGTLLASTLPAQITGGFFLLCACLALAVAQLLSPPSRFDPFLPWRIDGPWALAAAAGWATLVSSMIAALVAGRLAHRLRIVVSPWRTRAAVGLGGYGGLALSGGRTGLAVLIAAILTPLLVRELVFSPDGVRRPPRRTASRRRDRLLLAAAIALVLSYTVTHGFEVTGGAGNGPVRLRPGTIGRLTVALRSPLPATQLQQIGVTGDRTDGLRVVATREQAEPFLTARPSSLPRRTGSLATRWLTLSIVTAHCPMEPAAVDGLLIRYRTLGITTAEHVALQSRVAVSCRRSVLR